jgi:hypothetical protein
MHKLSSLKRRSLQVVAAKLGIAEETHDPLYDDHFERFLAYQKELELLKAGLSQLYKMNRDLLLHKKKTAEQLCVIVPVGEELHKVSKAIMEISDGSVDSFDHNVSSQYQTHVLDVIEKELQYFAELHTLHARRERKRKDFDAFRREVHALEQKPPGHKDLPAAKERLDRSDKECVRARAAERAATHDTVAQVSLAERAADRRVHNHREQQERPAGRPHVQPVLHIAANVLRLQPGVQRPRLHHGERHSSIRHSVQPQDARHAPKHLRRP